MIIRAVSLYLFVAVLLISAMFVYSVIRLKADYAKALSIFSFLLDIYLLGYMMEINASSIEDMYFWNQVQYFSVPFLPAFWFAISMFYTNRVKSFRSLKIFLVFIIPTITFILRITNGYHGWYYSNIKLKVFNGYNFLLLSKGPWYIVQTLYILVVFAFCIWFYSQRFLKSSSNRSQFRLLVIASLIPYFGLVLNSINLREIGVDYSAILLPISCTIVYISIVKYNFLELEILARERVFSENVNGLVLFNSDLYVMDYNYASEKYCEIMGVEMGTKNLSSIFEHNDLILDCIQKKTAVTIKVDQIKFPLYLNISVQDIKNKKVSVGKLLVFEDVTSREEINQKLLELSRIDGLSQLANRRYFMDISKNKISSANEKREKCAVVMIDIDNFKNINDTYGHGCGDIVISVISNILQSSFRKTDIIGRIGGEEFAVTMSGCTKEEVYENAEMFRKKVEKYRFEYQKEKFFVTVSIGFSNCYSSNGDMEDLMREADHALYKSKQNGKNRTSAFTK